MARATPLFVATFCVACHNVWMRPNQIDSTENSTRLEFDQGTLVLHGWTGESLKKIMPETLCNQFRWDSRIRALRCNASCELLDEKSTYDRDRRGNVAKIRRQVFRLAAEKHPLVQTPNKLFETSERKVKQEIATKLDKSWLQIERELFVIRLFMLPYPEPLPQK